MTTPPAMLATAPPADAYCASTDITHALRLAQSAQTRSHAMARISPACNAEATTVTVNACHTAMPIQEARWGQGTPQ